MNNNSNDYNRDRFLLRSQSFEGKAQYPAELSSQFSSGKAKRSKGVGFETFSDPLPVPGKAPAPTATRSALSPPSSLSLQPPRPVFSPPMCPFLIWGCISGPPRISAPSRKAAPLARWIESIAWCGQSPTCPPGAPLSLRMKIPRFAPPSP